jgi:hypothetical protein
VDDVGLFLRRHRAETTAVIERLDDDLVGQHIELLLHLALHVHVARRAEDVDQSRHCALVGDHLAGQRHVVQDARQLARGVRESSLLLDDESLDGDDGRRSMVDHGHTPQGGIEIDY